MSDIVPPPGPAPHLTDEEYLQMLSDRVRQARARGGMTRRRLAKASDVSERYLGQLESGKGNVSILLLRQIAVALNVHLTALVSESEPQTPQITLMIELLRSLSEEDRGAAHALLEREFGKGREKAGRIGLIGMRGAGKSTLGTVLARHFGLQFISLQSEITRRANMSRDEIYALSGARGYSRFEYAALVDLLTSYSSGVIEAGGAIVHDAKNFELMLRSCFTIWIKAEPEEHLKRVLAGGERLSPDVLRLEGDDVRQFWEERQAYYAQADATIETSGRSIEECADELIALVGKRLPMLKPAKSPAERKKARARS